MTASTPLITKNYLVARRQNLRHQKLWQQFKQVWRYGLLATAVAASVWLSQQSYWMLNDRQQITVTGQHHLATERIKTLLNLSLPLNLWQVEPQHLLTALQAEPLVRGVQVQRQLWPVGLTLQLQERTPIAQATTAQGLGVVDNEGVWLSLQRYPQLPRPALQLIGYSEDQRSLWQGLAPLLLASVVPIQQVYLQYPHDLILRSALGAVHLGRADPVQLQAQLTALAQLRLLPRRIDPERVAFIDLTDPQHPLVRLLPLVPSVSQGT